LGDLLGGLASVSNDLKNGTNGLHNPTNGSFPLHIPNLLNSTGGPPDLIHGIVSGVTNGTNGIVSGVTNGTNGIVSGITNGTNGLFGDKGLSNFGNGTGLEDAVGAVGSAFGKLFNGGLLPNPGNKTGDLLNGGLLPNPGNKTGDFFKGVGDKVASFFPDPKTYQGVFLGPLIGGVLDMLGTAVAGLLKGLGGFVINIFPKVGALGAQQLPGFLRLQTHDNLVEDLSHLKNTFLGAMRLESPVAADQFNIFFDKFYTVLERAHSADPSMAEALTSPTEENIRVALQSLSKVISDF
jgi:hypothetical protein